MKWIPEEIKMVVDSEELPTASLVSVDLEYGEDGNEIVLIGLFDGATYFGYLHNFDRVVAWLRTANWITHDGIHAELPVLNKFYGGFTAERIAFDTKIMAYNADSTRKNYSLKPLVSELLGANYPTYKELKKEHKFKSIGELDRQILLEYNAADTYYTWMLWQYFRKHYNQNQWQFLNTIEMPMTRLIAEMEQLGVKIDTAEVRRIHGENSKQRRKARKQIYALCGRVVNPNSPKQILQVLHEQGVKSKTTAEDEIKRYKDNPFVGALLEFRGYQKLCSTYTIPLYSEAIKTSDSRIHARFSQNTITGRLSSSDPINLQNQPQSVRSAFVPKEGYSFIEADYSNLEWRIPGHFSGDPAIISELSRRDGDIHMQTARLMFGESISDEQRRIAKTCNFLLTNSGRAKRLATELGCSYREADEIYNKFWAGYRVLGEWTKETKEMARRSGGVSTLYGRRVSLPDLQLWCGRANCPVVDKNYFCKTCFRKEETEREAVSVRVQGSGADLIKLAMLRLYREYKYVPVLTVHDSLMYEVEDSKVEEVSRNVKEVMESLVELKVPLFCDIGVAKNWGEC
jgi:DNA polymerase-1